MTLPDTSAWVEYLRATGSPVHLRLRQLVITGDPIAVTEPVEMEVLVGARTTRLRHEQRELLRSFTWLPFVAATDFAGAVQLYERCRNEGITPRGLIDCMIAAVALRHDVVVLAADRDMARIAEVTELRLDPAGVRP